MAYIYIQAILLHKKFQGRSSYTRLLLPQLQTVRQKQAIFFLLNFYTLMITTRLPDSQPRCFVVVVDFQTRNFDAQPALFSHGNEIFPRSNLRSPMFTATVSRNQKVYQAMAITIKHYSVLICITVYSKQPNIVQQSLEFECDPPFCLQQPSKHRSFLSKFSN